MMIGDRLSRYFLFATSFLALLAIGYKWMALGGNISWPQMLLYYGVPLVLSCLALAGTFLPVSARVAVCLCLFSLGAGTGAAEIFLGLTSLPPHEIKHRAFIAKWAEQGGTFDSRGKLQVVKDLRASGLDAYPKLNPGSILQSVGAGLRESVIRVDNAELIPLGTISKTVSVNCNEMGKRQIYTSDEYGFHNPSNIWASEMIQIAAVGDSFTEGDCVSSNENMVALIRKKYPLSLNLGMGGNGPLIELAALTEYLTHKRPKMVLWLYFDGNDIVDLEREIKSPVLLRYLEDGFTQDLIHRQSSIDRAIRAYIDREIERKYGAIDYQRRGLRDFLLLKNLRGKLTRKFQLSSRSKQDSDRVASLLRRILATAKKRTESWGGEFVFVYLPRHGKNSAGLESPAGAQPNSLVVALVRELEIRMVDLTPTLAGLAALNSLYPYPEMGHYNENGYRVAAARILEEIDEIVGSKSHAERR